MVKLYLALAVAGLMAGAFAPHLAARVKPPPNPNDAVMAGVPWREKPGWKDPLHIPPRHLTCIVEAMHYEAGNQSTIGQQAIAEVILNRMKSASYPKTACEVVHEKRGNVWQFSYLAKPVKPVPDNIGTPLGNLVLRVIAERYEGRHYDPTGGAWFYLNRSIADATGFHDGLLKKGWAETCIQDHCFQRFERKGRAFAEYMNARATGKGANR